MTYHAFLRGAKGYRYLGGDDHQAILDEAKANRETVCAIGQEPKLEDRFKAKASRLNAKGAPAEEKPE